jgi:hypothetical protein
VLKFNEVKDSQEKEKVISNINASGGTLYTRVFMKIRNIWISTSRPRPRR